MTAVFLPAIKSKTHNYKNHTLQFMKGKYITLNIMLACSKKKANIKKDIHAMLEETIAERKRIMQQLETFTQTAQIVHMILTDKKTA